MTAQYFCSTDHLESPVDFEAIVDKETLEILTVKVKPVINYVLFPRDPPFTAFAELLKGGGAHYHSSPLSEALLNLGFRSAYIGELMKGLKVVNAALNVKWDKKGKHIRN